MKNYIINRFGTRDTTGEVEVHSQDGEKSFFLDPHASQKVYNHSPDGFNFGYGGSGPAQLALAILMDFTGEVPPPALYQAFKFKFIATLPQETGGVIRGDDIQDFVDTWKAEQLGGK